MQIYVAAFTVQQFGSDQRLFAIAVTSIWATDQISASISNELTRRGYALSHPCTISTLEDCQNPSVENALLDGMAGLIGPSLPFLMSAFYKNDPLVSQGLSVLPLHVAAEQMVTDPVVDALWCPEVFHQVVFGGNQKTYVIFDSALCARIPGGFSPDLLGTEHAVKCLFAGDLSESASKVAPYLVDLSLTGVAPSIFQRKFAKAVWGKGAALVIRTDEEFMPVWRHLHKFIRVKSSVDAESRTYFRFWDPLVAVTYFGGDVPRPTLAPDFFNLSHDKNMMLVIEDGADAATLIWPSKHGRHSQIPDDRYLENADHVLMAKAAKRAFRRSLGHWLLAQHSSRFDGFSPMQMRALTRHVVRQAETLGLVSKDDMVYLCHMMLSAGGWFHLTDVLPDTGKMIRWQPAPSREHLAEAFMKDSSETAKAGLLAQWGNLHAHIKALPEDEQMTPDQFRKVLTLFLPDRLAAADHVLQLAKSDLPALALPEIQAGKLLLLSLILGYRFYTDPMLPWIMLSPAQAVSAAWTVTFG